MSEKDEKFSITAEHMNRYLIYLLKKGYNSATIAMYNNSITAFNEFIEGVPVTGELAEAWKTKLSKSYSAASVNLMTAAVNSFAEYLGSGLKIQRMKTPYHTMLVPQASEMTKSEYEKLLRTAKELGNERLLMIMRTVCATGIQISELSRVTAESLERGEIEVKTRQKGEQRSRRIELPTKLRADLTSYAEREGIERGHIFITRGGKPVHRSNIWAEMKQLCESAGVESSKVFPQNLRYLSIRTYYDEEKDAAVLSGN